ncbi:hypothetical protein A2415_03695 [candidate division WWE3 bacterium RIFOXYC1_FULL_39_7]|uniref:Glycosyl transferase family 1 domain-containing protein n=1 Tax=candidate division WWE3 bacterium RIFOXYC1_FULL_39_7 TaxID=1802643 RepID=A0A1F4WMN6_UNCKA|nr:MAG: hypothetical protein A2415_03695 [candidate division WWE3 bacterium RIFOXYC1_FULL_39_7]
MLTKSLFSKFNTYVAINENLVRDYVDLGIKTNQISYIPNGVDTNFFCPPARSEKLFLRNKFGIPENALVIVFSGRLVKEKGIDTLVEAFRNINREFPNTFLLIVGGVNPDPSRVSSESMLADFKNKAWATDPISATKKASKLGITNIKFTWSVANVSDYLKTSDIFVLPSFTEGLSNSLLEGMATGLAVVASNIPSVVPVIKNFENGLLFEAGNVDELTDRLRIFILSKKLSKLMGKRARELILERYSIEKTVDGYISVFTG